MKAEGNVEIVTADAAAAVAEQALLAVGALPPLRAHQQQGAVGGSAADIDDQHPLFFTEGCFEIEPGGHRFKLKDHIAETGAVGGPLKDPLRLGRSPHRRRGPRKLIGRPITAPVDLLGQLAFGLQFDVQHHGADQSSNRATCCGFSPLAPRKDFGDLTK